MQEAAVNLPSPDRPVGLLAAWGSYPIVVAEALKRHGYRVSCLGVKGHADPVLQEMCDDFRWIGLARLGAALRFFRRHGVQQATMAGKFHKVLIYEPWLWIRHFPDWSFLRSFLPYFIGLRDRKDDTLLGAICDVFAAEGIVFQPATKYVPELLVSEGQVAGRPPTSGQLKDIAFGWDVAKRLGGLDIGQSVCVKEQSVLAVEAIEGTDACIRRAGELCRGGGFCVIKVAKPRQDMRFDVPTVGLGTLETMVAAGARLLAIESGRTIVLDGEQFRRFADRNRLSIVALDRAGAAAAA